MPTKPQVGLHISIGKSLDLVFERAMQIGCTTLQMFTRSPRQWKFKPLDAEVVAAFREKRRDSGFRRVTAHMPYLPNLATSSPPMLKASRFSLDEEVKRCDELGIDYLVTHLGSHMGGGTMLGVRNISGAVNEALAGSSGDTMILLENMAGQQNSVGARFEDLMLILDRVKRSDRVGVCFDSCHAYAAGFDLASEEAVDRSLQVFDDCVGLDRLKVIHLNDSKGALGQNLDRHEYVGEGKIGKKGMKAIVNHKGIYGKPLIMEVPYDDTRGMDESIATVLKLLK